jgi:Xaa-Pro aminopeptidase
MPLNGERAFEILQREGVDTLVSCSTENVYYVSNYWSLGSKLGCGVQAYAILPIKEAPAVIAPIDEADLVLSSGTWIEDLRFYGDSRVQIGEPEEPSEQTDQLIDLYRGATKEEDGISALVKVIKEKNLTEGIIALDTSGMTPILYEYVKSKLPGAKLVDGTPFLQEIRMVKTDLEVERIKRATAITEKSMEDSLEIAREEITELDLSGMFAYSVAYDGGMVSQNLIGFRERSAFPNPMPSLFEAQRRDVIRLILGCTWDHYHSNISRTAVIGKPLQKVKRVWETIKSAQDAALEAITPGAKISDVYEKTFKSLESGELKVTPGALGHSLGVECNEQPWITAENDSEILEGMVINVDIPVLELGWGGIQIEDTVLVKSEGPELLTSTDRTLYLL